ncbi:hypothetical protein B9479_000557 [Cryptococcus floricola]|uniref:Protein kinase domain-containing protein n=1 Tax=Cryptococcus floricola TaxID=2591691 RepID=A0A5D3B7Y5_9TREE|nr:hypothetical protein B9479_000557 [Cryptococcus floricola]
MLARKALASAQSAYPRYVSRTRALTTTPLLSRQVGNSNTPWDASSSRRKGPNSFRNDARPGDRRPPFRPFRQPRESIQMTAEHFRPKPPPKAAQTHAHANMPGIGDASPHTPETVASWIRSFPLDPLEYDFRMTGMSTRRPTLKTYRIWGELKEKGIRVVYDQDLNGRLHASLKLQQELLENGVTPFMKMAQEVARHDARSVTVDSEPNLCGVMLINFFLRSTEAINAGLPSHLHGKWERCSDGGSGSTDWVFRRNGRTIAIVEVKLHTVLTTSGEGAVCGHSPTEKVGMTPRSMTQGDTAGRGGAQNDASDSDPSQADKKEDSDSDYVPGEEEKPDEEISLRLSLKLEQLLMACRQEGGLKLILASRIGKGGKVQPILRIVDQEGAIVPKMTHWAMGLSQLWEQLDRYKLDVVLLTSYEVWIPFERDPEFKNLLRVGDPIYRTAPETAPEPGKMSPMELAVASVIERGPVPPLGYTLPPLPVWSLSKASGNDSTQNDQNESGAGASGSRGTSGLPTKRGYDEVDGTGGAGSDNAIAGDANIPRDQLVPVTLQVSMPNGHSPDANHVFRQGNLDDGYMTGRLSPSVIASLADDDSIHSGLHTSELKADLALVSYISSGRLWDVYHSVLTVEGRVSKKLVAKVMCPDTYDDGDEYYKGFFEDSEEAMAAYRLEAALYSGPLASLQGGAVPALYGSYSGAMCLGLVSEGYPLHIELMEDVGGPAAGEGELRDLPLQDRQAIRDLYHQIHAVRVLHRDIEPRHIRRRADGRFALIDFDSSRKVKDGLEGDRTLASEGRRVAAMLGLNDRAVGKGKNFLPKGNLSGH